MKTIAEGTYTVTIISVLPFEQITIPNVSVTIANMTELTAIVFV